MAFGRHTYNCHVYEKWPIVSQTDTGVCLLVAFTGQDRLVQTVLQKVPELKKSLETVENWSVRWIQILPNKFNHSHHNPFSLLPYGYNKNWGFYFCLYLPLDSMFYIKLKMQDRIPYETYDLSAHLQN
jgi:hypothetical protein